MWKALSRLIPQASLSGVLAEYSFNIGYNLQVFTPIFQTGSICDFIHRTVTPMHNVWNVYVQNSVRLHTPRSCC